MDIDVDDLINEIKSGDQEHKDAAAVMLCRSKSKKAVQLLISNTYHKDSTVRGIAALCLGAFGEQTSVKALERLKTVDEDKNVRLAAFLALKYYGELSYEELKEEFELLNVLFLSCEPLMEAIDLKPTIKADIDEAYIPIDWLIIGGRSKSTGMPEGQPEWGWVELLLLQARETGTMVYWKTNLTVRPEEYPILEKVKND